MLLGNLNQVSRKFSYALGTFCSAGPRRDLRPYKTAKTKTDGVGFRRG